VIVWLAADLAIRVVIGGSLVLAGATKLASTVAWRQLWLAAHRLLPRWLTALVARPLPAIEMAVGLATLMGVLGSASMLASAALLAALALGVTTALRHRHEASCECLRMVAEIISWPGVARNGALAVLAALAGWHGGAELLGATPIGWPGQLALLAAAVLAVRAGISAVRAARRRRALAAIAARPRVSAPDMAG
jgi:Methylamine utilisation protein MauE